MHFFQKLILLCLSILVTLEIQGQNLYQKVDIPVEATLSTDWLKEKIRDQYPVLEQSELELINEIHSPGGIHYVFNQTYQGIPIYEAGIKVNLMPKNRITSFLSTLTSLPQQKYTQFTYPESPLYQRMAETWGAYEMQIEPYLMIKENQLIPVYQVIIHTYGDISSLEIIIDARDGKELLQKDRGAYYSKMESDTNGRARVFIPNPCTRAEVSYGDLFIDSMDYHKAIFEEFIDTVVLKDLTFENGEFKLTGPYVRINDRSPFFIDPATSTDGDFFFTRDQSGFEDVMAYYHIDSMQRYVQSIGFTNLQNKPLQVDPHGKSDLDQSVFIGNSGNSYLLFGDGGVDDAEDADVLIHEYAHALSYAAAPETNSGTERRGLDEGIGDYFAAVYSYNMNSGYGWEKIFNWDGHNEFWSGREVISHLFYPPTNTSIYTYGEIWASALMEIREEIGSEVADRLALQEMYGNFSQMSLSDAAMLYLDADESLYAGAHSEMLSFTFCQKGMLTGPDCINVSNEPVLIPEDEFNMYSDPTTTQLTLNWKLSSQNSRVRFLMTNIMGQEVFHQSLPEPSGEIFITPQLVPGIYLGILIIDEKRRISQKIQLHSH